MQNISICCNDNPKVQNQIKGFKKIEYPFKCTEASDKFFLDPLSGQLVIISRFYLIYL